MEVRDLLRFEHCGRTVYTLEDPAGLRCPVCDVVVRSGLMEAPVRIQIPVGNGHQVACCFLIASPDGAGGFSFINNVMRSEGRQPISRECFTSQYVLPRMKMTSSDTDTALQINTRFPDDAANVVSRLQPGNQVCHRRREEEETEADKSDREEH
ncbi:hypothetical protein INR49_001792 [Caranx melampygus]|nr:hypothetical protein INR49_001792 [Caranx melampygus]